MFSKTSRPFLGNPVEPQNPIKLQATSSMQPTVPTVTSPLFLEERPKDPTKAICQVQYTELKVPLLSSVVGRTTRVEPQMDVQVVSVDSGQTSTITPFLQTPYSPSSNPSTSHAYMECKMSIEQSFGTSPKSQPQTSLATSHQMQRVLSKSHSLSLPHESSQSSSTSSQRTAPKKVTPPHERHSVMPPENQQPQSFVSTPHQRQKVLAKGLSFPQTHEPSKTQATRKMQTSKQSIPTTQRQNLSPDGQPVVPHVPLQNEVYARAQALAKSRLERAKRRVQEHIQEVISVFSNTDLSKTQVRRKQVRQFHFLGKSIQIFI